MGSSIKFPQYGETYFIRPGPKNSALADFCTKGVRSCVMKQNMIRGLEQRIFRLCVLLVVWLLPHAFGITGICTIAGAPCGLNWNSAVMSAIERRSEEVFCPQETVGILGTKYRRNKGWKKKSAILGSLVTDCTISANQVGRPTWPVTHILEVEINRVGERKGCFRKGIGRARTTANNPGQRQVLCTGHSSNLGESY